MSKPSVSIAINDLDAPRSTPAAWANHIKPIFLVSWLMPARGD